MKGRRNIEIHCIERDGTHLVINRLTADNNEAKQNSELAAKLAIKAHKFAYDWGKVFPNDHIRVVEV
jgi:hypothetical protein